MLNGCRMFNVFIICTTLHWDTCKLVRICRMYIRTPHSPEAVSGRNPAKAHGMKQERKSKVHTVSWMILRTAYALQASVHTVHQKHALKVTTCDVRTYVAMHFTDLVQQTVLKMQVEAPWCIMVCEHITLSFPYVSFHCYKQIKSSTDCPLCPLHFQSF